MSVTTYDVSNKKVTTHDEVEGEEENTDQKGNGGVKVPKYRLILLFVICPTVAMIIDMLHLLHCLYRKIQYTRNHANQLPSLPHICTCSRYAMVCTSHIYKEAINSELILNLFSTIVQ